jgi:hypothetical protein
MFRDSFGDFAPEVPASVYAGVKKKMFWSNFMGFNIAQLNIWYVLLATSSIALLGWSNLEQNSTGIVASGSEYELKEFREPMMASVINMPTEEVENTAIQFSPQRSSAKRQAMVAIATKVYVCGGEVTPIVTEVELESTADKIEVETSETKSVGQEVIVVEQHEIASVVQTNLPVNMEGSIIEDSNLVDQLKKKDGPIELNMRYTKTATQEQ